MMLNRRAFLLGPLCAVPGRPLVAAAQQTAMPRRVGWLSAASATSDPHNIDAFQHKLRELGWVEGQNVVVEYRWTEGHSDRLTKMAQELVRLKVDVIVAPSPGPVVAARQATQDIPIVMVFGPDPVELGLVSSLARPDGNITGVTSLSADLAAKQIELFREKDWQPGQRHRGVLGGFGARRRTIHAQRRTTGISIRAPPGCGAAPDPCLRRRSSPQCQAMRRAF